MLISLVFDPGFSQVVLCIHHKGRSKVQVNPARATITRISRFVYISPGDWNIQPTITGGVVGWIATRKESN